MKQNAYAQKAGQKMKCLIKEKRYTQEEFAVCCNYADDSALRKRLRNGLDIDTVIEFCRYLDTDPKSFFNSLCEESIH